MTEPTNSTTANTADETALIVPLVTFAPDEIAEMLAAWARECTNAASPADCPGCAGLRRVEHVETEGSRRTWTLWESGTQTGHVRGRNRAAERWEREARKLEAISAPEILVRQDEHLAECCMDPTDEKWASPWTWEAAGSGRAALGLPALPAVDSGAESTVDSGAGESAEVSFEATDPTGDIVRVTFTTADALTTDAPALVDANGDEL